MKKKPDRKIVIATIGLIAGACAAAAAGSPGGKGVDFQNAYFSSHLENQVLPALEKKYSGDF